MNATDFTADDVIRKLKASSLFSDGWNTGCTIAAILCPSFLMLACFLFLMWMLGSQEWERSIGGKSMRRYHDVPDTLIFLTWFLGMTCFGGLALTAITFLVGLFRRNMVAVTAAVATFVLSFPAFFVVFFLAYR